MDAALNSGSAAFTFAALAFLSQPAVARPADGALGPTSAGSVQISASVKPRVRAFGVADLSTSARRGTKGRDLVQKVCLCANSVDSSYAVTVYGGGLDGRFDVSTGGGRDIPFTIHWGGAPAHNSDHALVPGVSTPSVINAAAMLRCGADTSRAVNLTVTLPEEVDRQPYSGQLTLLVALE